MGAKPNNLNIFRPIRDPRQGDFDPQTTSYIIRKPCPDCAPPNDKNYYVENLMVSGNPDTHLWRTLDKEGKVNPQAPFLWDEGDKRTLAFLGKSPCRLDQFNFLGSFLKCLPTSLSNVALASELSPFTAVYENDEAKRVEEQVQRMVDGLAQFYAGAIADTLSHAQDPIEATRTTRYDEEGNITRSLSVFFRNESLFEKWSRFYDWREANNCPKLDRNKRIAKEINYPEYIDYISCFDLADDGVGFSKVKPESKIHNAEMVDAPQPPTPEEGLSIVELKDEGLDGTVDAVKADTRASGDSFEIPVRSSYTAGLLAYFDPILRRVQINREAFEVPEPRYSKTEIPDRTYSKLHVGWNKPCVKAGESVATIITKSGKTVEVLAEQADCFEISSSAEHYSDILLKPKPR